MLKLDRQCNKHRYIMSNANGNPNHLTGSEQQPDWVDLRQVMQAVAEWGMNPTEDNRTRLQGLLDSRVRPDGGPHPDSDIIAGIKHLEEHPLKSTPTTLGEVLNHMRQHQEIIPSSAGAPSVANLLRPVSEDSAELQFAIDELAAAAAAGDLDGAISLAESISCPSLPVLEILCEVYCNLGPDSPQAIELNRKMQSILAELELKVTEDGAICEADRRALTGATERISDKAPRSLGALASRQSIAA